MAFTDDDRNILIEAATEVRNIKERLAHLPCEQEPPVCTQEIRLASLESTRNRTVGAVVTTAILSLVAGISYLITKIGG